MNFAIYQSSQIGGRTYNQDRVAYAYSKHALMLVLADGMGGHLHGEIAAQLAVQTFVEAFERSSQAPIAEPEEFLRVVMLQAHQAIIQYAQDKQLGGNPGTTCVAALLQDGQVCWAHAGDSRLYLVRSGEVMAKTHDHSMVQQWADWGIITVEEMKIHPDRNKITNCLGGVDDMFFVESSIIMPLQQGDTLLLCSDGLWSPLADTEIAAFCSATSAFPLTLKSMMDMAAERAGAGADNITAVAARWGEGEQAHDGPVPFIDVLDCH